MSISPILHLFDNPLIWRLLYSLMNEHFEKAAESIRKGNLIVFPTETVYGLGADAGNPQAVAKIYQAKQRPVDNPLIVHVADAADVQNVAASITVAEETLINAFWPGPLTIVFPRHNNFSAAVCAGGDTIAVRCPDDETTRAIIRLAQTPIAAPSANVSGRPSPTRMEHLDEEIIRQVQYVVPGKPCEHGLESTVVRMTDNALHILRPGAITREQLQEVVNVPVEFVTKDADAKASPGTRHPHYRPTTPLFLVYLKNLSSALKKGSIEHQRIAVLADAQTITQLQNSQDWNDRFVPIILGEADDAPGIAANLFHHLHEVDQMKVDVGYVQAFARTGVGAGIMDRLMRACDLSLLNDSHTN